MKKLIILLSYIILNSCMAQNITVPENLKKLTDESFQHYPKVKEMYGLTELGRVKTSLNKAGYLPVAKIDGSYMYMDPVSKISIPMGPVVKEFNVMTDNSYSAMLNVNQPLLNFNTSASVDKAESEYVVSSDNYNNFRNTLAYQTAQIYFGIIYLTKNLGVQQMQLDLLNENIKLIEARLKNGDALKYDLISTQVRYANVENAYAEIRNQINKQYNLLNMFTGRNGCDYISDNEFDHNIFNMTTDSADLMAEKYNMDIITAKDKIITNEKDFSLVKTTMLPVVNLMAAAGYKNGISPDLNKVQFNYSAGVGVSIPILPASRPSIQKEIAQVNLEISRNALESQRLSVAKDIQNANDDIRKNKIRLQNAGVLVDQASQALELANRRYKDGVITNLDLLTAQTNFQDAQLSRLQTEYSLLLAKLELNRISGCRWWQ